MDILKVRRAGELLLRESSGSQEAGRCGILGICELPFRLIYAHLATAYATASSSVIAWPSTQAVLKVGSPNSARSVAT